MENTPALAIANRIFTIRGKLVMLDSDLSVIFTIQVKRINEQVNRNSKRFPDDFSCQLSHDEWQILKSLIATSSNSKGGKVKAPRVFTEHGIAMIAMLLRSELAIQMSIQIIQVFIQSRATHAILQSMGHRMTQLEQ